MNFVARKKINHSKIKTPKLIWINSVLLVILLLAHFVLGENGRNLFLTTSILLVIIVFFFSIYAFSRYNRNAFVPIILIYYASHFPIFLIGGGGLFNLVSFGLLLPFIFLRPFDVSIKDRTSLILFSGLIIFNTIGYFYGDLGLRYKLNGFIAFSGIMFILYISHKVILTKSRVKVFVKAASILGFVNLFVTLNTLFDTINIHSPLLISFYEKSGTQIITNTGTINSVELFGEWGMLNSFFLLPFITLKQATSYFNKTDKIFISLGLLCSIFCALLSFSKSVTALLIIGIVLYFIFVILFLGKWNLIPKLLIIIPSTLFLFPFISSFFGFEFILERIEQNPEFLSNFLDNPLTAKGTSREEVYRLGWEQLSKQTWFFGNGWSIPQGNYYSWFGTYTSNTYADFHSLYLCLVPLIGYSGLFIFCLLFLRTIWSLYFNIKKNINVNTLLTPLMVGLFFVLIFFLIDEYKINATRNSFFTIVIIWLGLAINVNNMIKNNLNLK